MMKRRLLISTFILLFGIIGYFILYGRLVPVSPIVVGFEKQEFEKTIVYFHGNEDISEFKTVDSLIQGVEQFHGLHFNRPVEIFICKSKSEMKRLTGTTTRMNAHPVYGRVFVSAKANKERKEGKINFETYLKHELSHSLLFQNMTLVHALHYPGWFMEGIATYSADQMGVDGYYTRERIIEKIKEGLFVEPRDWRTVWSFKGKGKSVKECPIEDKYRFIYSEYGLIVENLIQTFGSKEFNMLLEESLSDRKFYDLFEHIYGIKFDKYISEFKTKSH